MLKKRELPTIIIFAAIITALFHKQALGLNLLIITLSFLAFFKLAKQLKFESKNQIISIVGLILSSFFTVITHSPFSYILYFISLFIFAGLLIYPEAKTIVSSIILSWSNLMNSQVDFIIGLTESGRRSKKIYKISKKLILFIAPMLVIFLFILLYRISNLYFDSYVNYSYNFLQNNVFIVFEYFDAQLIFTFIVGTAISNFLIVRTKNMNVIRFDNNSDENLYRRRKKTGIIYKFNSLRNEFKAGIFLFLILNIILLIVNIIDLYWVWFNFQWQGQNLKQFVHEGTYILILSILISVIIVLYFFRKNINFYKKNRFLVNLTYIWLIQNAFLAVSVAIRNYWYINYYALAYRRIGVGIFLVMTLFALYSVFIKVRQQKSFFYLLKTNSIAIFIILSLCSFINWDNLIAEYNFKYSDRSFLHLDFLATLSDQTLPILDKQLSELEKIDKTQKDIFHLESKFMTPEEYCNVISERKKGFKMLWESKSILEWNLPEYLAYSSLFQSNLANK